MLAIGCLFEQLKGLPNLKALWLSGTSISAVEGAEATRSDADPGNHGAAIVDVRTRPGSP